MIQLLNVSNPTTTALDVATATDEQLLDAALQILRARLPQKWGIESQPVVGETHLAPDLVISSGGGSGQTMVLVEVRRNFVPRDVDALTGGLIRRLRGRAGQTPILLVTPYLSERSRELLAEQEISYIDLTGNVRVSLDYPGLFIETPGAERAPTPTTRRATGLRGAKLGAVVRVLVDAYPPYTAKQISRKAGVNVGYLSRILETLNDEGLIQRAKAGPITDTDWPALLRQRSAALTLFRNVGTNLYVARTGIPDVLSQIALTDKAAQPVITGSFAAARLAPVAPSPQLVLYSMDPRKLSAELSLLEVESGADTVIIRPENPIALSRPMTLDGLLFAAPSQVAIDCLSGNGRMPAEGEALIDWMRDNQSEWRAPTIDDLPDDPAMAG